MIKVKGYSDLRRDEVSGAILNTNAIVYQAAVARKRRLHDQTKRIETLENEIEKIKRILTENARKA